MQHALSERALSFLCCVAQDRAVFAMCSLKVSWSSKITPRFVTEVDVVIVDEPN